MDNRHALCMSLMTGYTDLIVTLMKFGTSVLGLLIGGNRNGFFILQN